MQSSKKNDAVKKSGFERFIKYIEIVGNKLPHPFILFTYLAIITLIISCICSYMGVSVIYLAAGREGAEAVETTVTVKNLLSFEGLRPFLSNFVNTYVSFAPLGLIMVMMLGISLIEQTGFISALMRKTILGAPTYLVTAVLAFVGINANLASDAGMLFTAAIGGALYKALGRNPVIGIVVGFSAASGGFTANLLIAGTDALLAGITESAAKGMDIVAPIHPLMNWYFMIVATFVITFVTTIVCERFTKRVLDEKNVADSTELEKHRVNDQELKGLKYAGIAAVVCLIILLVLAVPSNGFLRNDEGGFLPSSPLTQGVVGILFFFFLIVGIAYGIGAKTVESQSDIPKLMQKGLQGSLSFLVVVLPAAIFISFFNQSNLTTVLAVKGAEALQAMNLGGIPLLILFILLCAFLNLFMMSGSAKWLILAPIFVPMLSVMGLSPALSQVAYRIGDSSTNIISPLSYYVPVIIGLIESYKPEDQKNTTGIGTVLSLTMPYSIAYLIALVIMLIIWYVLKLPLGPGVSLFM